MGGTIDVNVYSNATIEQLAEGILARAGFSECSGPIDIVVVAKSLGINVYPVILENTSGYIKFEDSQKNIYVNDLEPKKRKRFTIAHEIGHFLLHRNLIQNEGSAVLYRSTDAINRDILEIQANKCAAALLMPRNRVSEQFNAMTDAPYVTKLITLANLFNVSVDAMDIRLTVLGLAK